MHYVLEAASEEKKKVINENSKDDEHPLFMDALNKFDGDIIK